MAPMHRHFLVAMGLVWLAGVVVLSAQRGPAPALGGDPAIAYATAPGDNVITRLNEQLLDGRVTLRFDPVTGYLKSVLDALDVTVDSQMLVFSKTSFQAPKISPQNPRALYFNDSVSVGWVRHGDLLEAIAQDPRQGALFYTLDQNPDGVPQFKRNATCLSCHMSETAHVPGMTVGSVMPALDGMTMYGPAYTIDHRSLFETRWGGWYVTGKHTADRHMGNIQFKTLDNIDAAITPASVHVDSLAGRFDPTGYLSTFSDIVALMTLEHQGHMANLLTRIGWEARVGEATARRPLKEAAIEVVDYMLFVDEAALPGPVSGPTTFAKTFSARGPADRQGRSLRQFDLQTRMMKYPCSYMIYSEVFDALPPAAKAAVYERLWYVLNGGDKDPVYAKLSAADRRAIIEILGDTRKDLPTYWVANAG
jgi:hypothetical protein